MKDIISAMNWRYATKQYDTAKPVRQEDIGTILEAVRLAPTSFGLQPFKLLVVTNPDIRQKLRAAAWDQPQVTDAAVLIVFAVETVIGEALVDAYMKRIVDIRDTPGMSIDMLSGFKDMIMGTITGKSQEQLIGWATRQAYIGLGTLIESAALLEVDASPMEGFDPSAFDEILGLSEKGLKSVVIAGIGYRSETDKTQTYKKVRLSKEEMIIEVK